MASKPNETNQQPKPKRKRAPAKKRTEGINPTSEANNQRIRSKYDPDRHPTWAWYLAYKGYTEPEIAAEFGISHSTLTKWKKDDDKKELVNALKNSKGATDSGVIRSLRERAIGYTVTERKVVSERLKRDAATGKDLEVTRIEEVTKHIPPDTVAMIYWLKNRLRQEWKDKWPEEMDIKDARDKAEQDYIDELLADPDFVEVMDAFERKKAAGSVKPSSRDEV